jgi:hypothetical protein
MNIPLGKRHLLCRAAWNLCGQCGLGTLFTTSCGGRPLATPSAPRMAGREAMTGVKSRLRRGKAYKLDSVTWVGNLACDRGRRRHIGIR